MDILLNIMQQALADNNNLDYNMSLLYTENTKQLIYGKDGVGKTYFAIHQQLNYCKYTCIIPVYIDGDSKNSKQKSDFAKLYLDNNGIYLNYHIWKLDKAKRVGIKNVNMLSQATFLDFIEAVIAYLLEKSKNNSDKFFIVIDNYTLLIGGEENDTRKVGELTTKLNELFDDSKLSITLIAHSGKDETKGVRGSNILQSIFGQILYIDADIDDTRYLVVKKDSLDNLHKQSKVFYIRFDKNNGFILEQTDNKIISKDMVMFYKEKKLKDLTYYVLLKLKRINANIIKLNTLKHIIMHIGGQFDISDKRHLSPSFVDRYLKSILSSIDIDIIKIKIDNSLKLAIDISKLDEKLLDSVNIDEYNIEQYIKDKIAEKINSGEIIIENNVEPDEDSRFIQIKKDIVNLLKKSQYTTQQLRDAIYVKKDKKDMQYSKYFARNVFNIVLNELENDNIIKVETSGRKKTYSLLEEE